MLIVFYFCSEPEDTYLHLLQRMHLRVAANRCFDLQFFCSRLVDRYRKRLAGWKTSPVRTLLGEQSNTE